ncbi:hypothetical protein F0344_33020 [Streptomyces finlayi]|uniref:Uncharacterized protein n=1 Tax=Streptomyces finlayi TaxID=67296 RepID=A0A7G7BTX1_9ACTN|nr:hypothetical protein [Streptomyces finlayi]QNE78786.1 hypothetical protein F0344_33020 [Streptomyces finlayi]
MRTDEPTLRRVSTAGGTTSGSTAGPTLSVLLFVVMAVIAALDVAADRTSGRRRVGLLGDPDPDGALRALRSDLMDHVQGPPHDDVAMLLLRCPGRDDEAPA